ncbi:hypothetical protein IU474_28535 [Nocardia otitidiscaviarum]|uniref:hypothetical protein n=1 Tax=Nocardia otitidiscaviarum TaxID=1823 RepID=UPI001895D5A7|nr:hypothetical protein [Nocardia otitidiscaviarum]MBF6240999.1 hypothetical protein [Nocardia otitidiscaviarum]
MTVHDLRSYDDSSDAPGPLTRLRFWLARRRRVAAESATEYSPRHSDVSPSAGHSEMAAGVAQVARLAEQLPGAFFVSWAL